jgi:hypothetical protein
MQIDIEYCNMGMWRSISKAAEYWMGVCKTEWTVGGGRWSQENDEWSVVTYRVTGRVAGRVAGRVGRS